MRAGVYKKLLEVMKSRGGMYAGADIPEFYAMAEELFTPTEAEANNAMPKGPFTADQLAQLLGWDEKQTGQVLEGMADKGLCMALKNDGVIFYMRSPFMPGIFEFQFMPGKITDRDKRIARLIHDYKKACDAGKNTEQAPAVPTIRVITIDSTVSHEDTVHTHDQVQTYIDKNDVIAISTCYCRHAAVLRDEDIHGMPTDTCMQFGMSAQFAIERLGARRVSKKEAREVLNRCEAAGLIHMSQNMADNVGFICNCDRWHCTPVSQALRTAAPRRSMSSGFVPQFDADACSACETCIDRCPGTALVMGDADLPELNMDRCFGCAVCATGCPSEAIAMVHEADYAAPPKDGKALKAALKSPGV